VARYYRSAKIMEIIEGTTQVHELVLGKTFVADAVRRQHLRHRKCEGEPIISASASGGLAPNPAAGGLP
jgi:hypothetical protein